MNKEILKEKPIVMGLGPEYKHGDQEFSVNDLTLEKFREYVYEDGYSLRVNSPYYLFVNKKTKSHRVQDSSGIVTYIPSGWKFVRWMPLDSKRPVQF